MLERLVKYFKTNIPILLIFALSYYTLGGLVMGLRLNKTYLILIDIVFGFVALMFDSYFDLYKTNRYRSRFLISIIISGISILIVSMIIVYLGIDVNKFEGFKSFSFNIFILIGGYIVSILLKEIRYFFEKNK